MKNTRRAYLGATLLEYAIALPVVLALLLGSIDVSRVLQVQAALNQGSKEALRCLYPTDGGCTHSTYAPGSALYNWYASTAAVRYDMNTFDYDAVASWFNVPRYTYSGISARVLNAVEFDTPQRSFSARRVSYARSQQFHSYVRLTKYPYITGTNGLSPQFRYKEPSSNGVRPPYPPAQTVSLSNIDLATAPGGTISASVTFVIPAPYPNAPAGSVCFPSAQVDRRDATTDIELNPQGPDVSCTVSDVKTETAVIIHPKGTAHGTGKATIHISGPGLSRPLGGRVWNGTTNGNFVPRGVTEAAYINQSTGAQYREYSEYSDLRLRYNRPITLTFEIEHHPEHPTAHGEWHGTSLDIYLPEFGEKLDTLGCAPILRGDYLAAQGAGSAIPGCSNPPSPFSSMSPRAVVVNSSVNVDSSPLVTLGCKMSSGAAISTLGTQSVNYDVVISASQCAPATVQGDCPPNTGVPELPDAAGFIRNSPSALSKCAPGANAEMQAAGVSQMTNVRWTERVEPVVDPQNPTEPYRFTFTKATCDAQMTLPPFLAAYPQNKLQLGTPTTELVPVYTGTEDPSVLRATNVTRYGCSELSIFEQELGEGSTPPLPTESLFVGSRADLGDGCWQEALRAEALEQGVPEGAFVKFGREAVGYTTFDAPPQTGCGQAVTMRHENRGESLITQAALAEGVVPPQCVGGGLSCRAELERFVGGSAGELAIDEAAAKARALEAIQAAYPLGVECSDLSAPNCVKLSLARHGSPGVDEAYQVEASAKVPLGILLGRSIELSAAHGRSAEGNYVR